MSHRLKDHYKTLHKGKDGLVRILLILAWPDLTMQFRLLTSSSSTCGTSRSLAEWRPWTLPSGWWTLGSMHQQWAGLSQELWWLSPPSPRTRRSWTGSYFPCQQFLDNPYLGSATLSSRSGRRSRISRMAALTGTIIHCAPNSEYDYSTGYLFLSGWTIRWRNPRIPSSRSSLPHGTDPMTGINRIHPYTENSR